MRLLKHTLCGLFLLCLHQVNSQVTTATLSGTITSKDNKPLPGATIQVSFPEAGIKRTILAQTDGSFVIPNLRVGGPYSVLTSFAGFTENKEENIFLFSESLNVSLSITIILKACTIILRENAI